MQTAKQQLWNSLLGKWSLKRTTNHSQLCEGHEVPDTKVDMPIHGESEFTSRIPTDKSYQFEYLQRSKMAIVRKTGEKPTDTIKIRVFRCLNGEWSVWRSGSDGVAVGGLAVLTLRQEIAPPAGQHKKKFQGPSFRVMQEPKGAGKEESERIDLRFFIEQGAGWKMQAQIKKGEKLMTQKDTYKIR